MGRRSCLFVCGVALFVSQAGAGLIDPREVNLVIGSWTVDAEMLAAGYIVGIDPQALAYSSTIGPNGWTGTLSGTYLGMPVLVNYNGTFTPTSASTASISVMSLGTIDGQPWDSTAVWSYSDPSFKGTVGTSLNVSISGTSGVFTITASLDKNLISSALTADVTASVLSLDSCSLADAGLSFSYNQQTGADTSTAHTSLICGLFSSETVVDRTQVFRTPTPPPPPPPPPRPFTPPPYPPYPAAPPGSTPGFDSSNSSTVGYEYMYIANTTPEPGTWALAGLGVVTLVIRRRYRRRR